LLGGKMRDRIRSYTYIYDRHETKSLLGTARAWTQEPERVAEMAVELVEEGFTGLKFDPILQFKDKTYRPWDLSQSELCHAERAVGAVREAVGERADIMIGTHGQITPAAAIRLAARLEKFDPLWLEEPCPPENYAEMGRVARATTIPISTGERLVTPYEFQLLFAEGACAVAQPDLGSAGGITATKKIATLAEANYVLMAPHVWGGPIITAAAIQIDANIPNFLIQESIGKSDGFFDEIIKEPFIWEKGEFVVTDRPGIGIELDEDSLEKYRSKLSDFSH
jgi:2-dehydro-3-deoxyphosphogalactonate aldolase